MAKKVTPREAPVELIDVNEQFISGQTGAFSKKTTAVERKEIVKRLNGFTISDEKRRFVDLFIFSGGDAAHAYKTVFDKDDLLTTSQAKKRGARLLANDKDVVNYSDFVREQATLALGFKDKAEEYMSMLIQEMMSQTQGDVYDYVNYDDGMVSIKDPKELSDAQRRRVKRLRIVTTTRGKGEKKESKATIDVELWNKEKIMDMMLKHLKGYTQRSFGSNTSEKVEEILTDAEKAIESEYFPDAEEAEYKEVK